MLFCEKNNPRIDPAIPVDFNQVIAHRKHLRKSDPKGKGKQLSRGTTLAGVSTSPYSWWDTGSYFKGLLFGDKASWEKCKSVTPIGKISTEHCVGVRSGTLQHNVLMASSSAQAAAPECIKIIFAGDLMVSESGMAIQISTCEF